MLKLRAYDWLKTSAFACNTSASCNMRQISSVMSFCNTFFMEIAEG